jgi:hypothetical protein
VGAVARRSRRLAAILIGFAAAAVPCLLFAQDAAAQARRERPPQEEPEHYPDGPNREETFYFCTACHGFKIVAAQGLSRERWDETLTFMTSRHNMPDVQGQDREKMLDYLTTAFPERRAPGGWKNPFAPK